MPGLNSAGVPYPLDSDPIADWPQIMAEMAQALKAMAVGGISLSDGGEYPRTGLIHFPAGMFTDYPTVFLSLINFGASSDVIANYWTTELTATSARVNVARNSTGTMQLAWLALGR